MIQPSIERTATAPVEVRVSVVAGLEPLEGVAWGEGGGESTSISAEAMFLGMGGGEMDWRGGVEGEEGEELGC